MHSIPKSRLDLLPFVDHVPTDGRVVPLHSYFDPSASDWHLYLEVEPGTLGRIAGGEPVYGCYLARSVADAGRDVEFPLGTLISQHLSFGTVLRQLWELESDIHQCAATLEKYHLISSQRSQAHSLAGLLVTSELEYLLLLLRSLYDALQSLACSVTRLFVTQSAEPKRVVQDLPSSFARVVLKGTDLISSAELTGTFGLPKPLADWYESEGPNFQTLRDLRDGIVHKRKGFPTVFELSEGLAITISESPWDEFDIWENAHLLNGRFGSLRALFASLATHALETTTRFQRAVRSSVQLPAPISREVRVFLRSSVTHRLVSCRAMIAQPWEGSAADKRTAG